VDDEELLAGGVDASEHLPGVGQREHRTLRGGDDYDRALGRSGQVGGEHVGEQPKWIGAQPERVGVEPVDDVGVAADPRDVEVGAEWAGTPGASLQMAPMMGRGVGMPV